jgi:uncharacterized protein (DUF1810 family)
MDDPYDLERFVTAENADGAFDRAVAEVSRGAKSSHWMWFVFPQISGLGQSAQSRKFAIASLAEAQAYLHHPILGARLFEVAGAVLTTRNRTAVQIFGKIDAQKLQSSMTLFMRAAPGTSVFEEVLEGHFDGLSDPATLRLLEL